MKLKAVALAVFAAVSFSSVAHATCVGSSTFYTCFDSQSGNSYSVNRFGGTTIMNGTNSRTGSTWSQTTNSFGGNSYTTGRASNGSSWNMTTTPYGSYGTDSRGNSFSNWGGRNW